MDSKKRPVPTGLVFGHYHVIPDDVHKRLLAVRPTMRVVIMPDMHIGARHLPSPSEILERLKQQNFGRKLAIFYSRGDSLENPYTTRKADQS